MKEARLTCVLWKDIVPANIFYSKDEHNDWKPLNLEIMRRFTLFAVSFAMEFDGCHCESCTTQMKEARLTCVLWKDIVPANNNLAST